MSKIRGAGRWVRWQLVRIRTRLLVINLVAVLVPVVGIEWARTFERESLAALERDMRHAADVLRTVLEKNLDPRGRPRFEVVGAALEAAAKRTRMRIRVLDRRGVVIADSHAHGAPEGPEPTVSRWFGADPPPARRHRRQPATDPGPLTHRVEVRAAIKGQLGTATRVHERIERVFLFLAMPVMVKRRVEGVVYITRSTTPVLFSLYRLRRNLIQVLGVALGVTALMSLFLATTISRPLGRLTRAATRIAQGDRTRPGLTLRRNDELGQLARAFDAMVKQLDERARYISEFAANISHEFKTPLASIRGAAELLADGAVDDPAARGRFLGNILADVQRMDRQVSRILELSRIEATLEQREPVDIEDVVRTAAEQLGAPAAVDVAPAAEGLSIRANRAHLESALAALLENAVQHGPTGEPISVALDLDGAEVRIRVSDRGPGISEANRERIFDRFFTTRADEGGTGLGLAIVATVVRAHGGRVALQSAPGQGATFELRLPRG